MPEEKHEREKKKEEEEGKEFRQHAYAERYAGTRMSTAWQGWVNGVLGIWLIAVPFFGLGLNIPVLVVTGIVIAIVGFWAAAMRPGMWQQWVNGILGLWVIAVPFLLLTGATLFWTLGITGLIVAILGFWAAARENM